MDISTDQACPCLSQDTRHQWLDLLEPLTCYGQCCRGRSRDGAESPTDATHHRRRIPHDRARRRHQLTIAADQGVARLGRSRLSSNHQHAPAHTAQAIPDTATRIAQCRTGAMHGTGQDADAILKQQAVGRIVHIRFCNRGVDAKSPAVRDPGTLGDLDDLPMQVLDDLGPEGAGDLQNRFGVGYVASIDAREHAIHEIGAHLALQVVVAPIREMLQNQHPNDDNHLVTDGRWPSAQLSDLRGHFFTAK